MPDDERVVFLSHPGRPVQEMNEAGFDALLEAHNEADRYRLALQALVVAMGPCGSEADRSCWHRRDTFSGALLEWAFLRPCPIATARAVGAEGGGRVKCQPEYSKGHLTGRCRIHWGWIGLASTYPWCRPQEKKEVGNA